jgi:RND family efflux transporter MFP subunit
MLAAAVALMGWTTRRSWLPAETVDVVPVMILPVSSQVDTAAPAQTTESASDPDRAGESQTPGPIVAQASGWIEPDPYPIYITGLADGIIEQIHVLEGQDVRAGQLVATLVEEDARLTDALASASLQSARALLQQAEARLSAARREWDNPVERTRAVETTTASLAQAKAQLKRVESRIAHHRALLEDRQAVLEASRVTFAGRGATELEVTQARLAAEAQQALLAATQQEQKVLARRIEHIEAQRKAAMENQRLRIPEKRELDEAKAARAAALAQLEHARARREETALRLRRMRVLAPKAGRVMQLLKAPGDKLMTMMDNPRSAQVAGLYNPEKLQVRVDVPLADAAKVRVGLQATIVADILPDKSFSGRVTRIVRQADIQKNTLEVKVAIDEPDPQLAPEVLARVKFHASPSPAAQNRSTQAGGAKGQRLFVPSDLVAENRQGHYVYLFDDLSSRARRREVEPGPENNGWVQIRQGLQPGDRLIALAPEKLSDGQRLRVNGESRNYDRSRP